jgi:hypothetical protein
MDKSNIRWLEYYISGKYRGFYLKEEARFRLAGKINLTFSNGEKNFLTSGKFREEALEKMFDRIDAYWHKKSPTPLA